MITIHAVLVRGRIGCFLRGTGNNRCFWIMDFLKISAIEIDYFELVIIDFWSKLMKVCHFPGREIGWSGKSKEILMKLDIRARKTHNLSNLAIRGGSRTWWKYLGLGDRNNIPKVQTHPCAVRWTVARFAPPFSVFAGYLAKYSFYVKKFQTKVVPYKISYRII